MSRPILNLYTCHKCRRFVASIALEVGKTPDEIPCITAKCDGVMFGLEPVARDHLDPKMLPQIEFYRPEPHEEFGLSPENRKLLERGCLIRRGYTGGSRREG